jgi:hypothetical protein
MASRVLIWNYVGSKSAFGHASLRIGEEIPQSSVYVSWWPNCTPGSSSESYWKAEKQEYFGLCEPKRSRKFSDDIADENGRPDRDVLLIGLDEAAMKQFWADLTADPRAKWNATTTNCAAAVAAALQAGGSEDYFGVIGRLEFAASTFPNWWAWTPEAVYNYSVQLAQYLREAGKSP